MKWILFALSLLALWIAFNSLFMLPGRYSAFNFELAAAGIIAGVLLAWISSRRFVAVGPRAHRSAAVMKAPPMVLCIFILFVFCAIGAIKLVAYW